MISAFSAILWFFVSVAAAECPPQDIDRRAIDRINNRYDDFFRHRREREEREAKANVGAEEVKARREAQMLKMEEARRNYVREPEDEAREENLRLQWEEQERQRQAKMEEARKCEVAKRTAQEQLLQRGRKIPELKEFDLEDY